MRGAGKVRNNKSKKIPLIAAYCRTNFNFQGFMEKVTQKQKYTRTGMLGYFLRGCKLLFLASIAASLITTFLNVVIPQVISFTIDSVIDDKAPNSIFARFAELFGGLDYLKRNIWILAVVIAAIALVMAIFQYCVTYFNQRANQTLMRGMRNSLFSHIQRLPLSWHVEHQTGDIIQRCTSDADAISNFISNQLVYLFRIIIIVVLSVTFMFVTNAKLAAIALAFVPVLVGTSLIFYKGARKSFKKCDEEEGVLSTIAQENLTGVRVVRAFGRERFERDKFEKQNVYYTGLWVKVMHAMARFWTTIDSLAAIQGMVLLIVGTLFCVDGEMTPGELVAFISYNTMLMGPVRQLGRIISNMSRAGVSIARIGEIMNADEEEYGEAGELSGDIEFKDVGFSYEEGKPVLSNVSFRVPQGSTLGVLGSTGSGKSTLMYLLDRLYPVTEGHIYIGGRDINEIPPATVRSNIGFVLQEGYLYTGTIAENISVAGDNISQAGIEHAAQAACVDDNIRSFAQGYETVVGERGVTLSGGQKQRVSIARTLVRKTPILVFDDSLSAVDSDTDAAIRARLANEFGGATVILISHRITTVMHADNIIVMDGGTIAEQGTSHELLQKDGIYRRIYDMQMSLPDDIKKEVGYDE